MRYSHIEAPIMAHPAGEADCGVLRLDFDRRLKLEFHGSRITSDAGLLAFRELDDVLGLSQMAGNVLADTRTGHNSRHGLEAKLGSRFGSDLTAFSFWSARCSSGVTIGMRAWMLPSIFA
jgi:hypothetical protein